MNDNKPATLKEIEKQGRADGRRLREKFLRQMPGPGQEIPEGLVDDLMEEVTTQMSGWVDRMRAAGASDREIEAWRKGCSRSLKRVRAIYTKVL